MFAIPVVNRLIRPLLIIWIVFHLSEVSTAFKSDIEGKLTGNETRLSRRKRYIIFPEGSSFQLVYCLTMPTYGVGRIFTMGLTAALAWQLPSEPIHLNDDDKPKEDKDKEMEMTMDMNMEMDKDKENKAEKRIDILQKPSYPQNYGNYYGQYKKVYTYEYKQDPKNPVNFIPMGNTEISYVPAYKNNKIYYENRHVHRRTRRDLFDKIEKFFMAQNKDGRACLLKAICEVNQKPKDERGSFVEEIIKAIFTWLPDDDIDPSTAHLDYASTYKKNCSEKYPECAHSVFNVFF